jgi:tryptophan synthase alpha chain
MTRIGEKFLQLKGEGKKAFIPYITLGDPDLQTTLKLVLALEKSGADVIELGVPFSDPLADGPVIQRAAERALAGGCNVGKTLAMVRQLRTHTEIPLLLFSYYNPLYAYGFEALSEQARDCGLDGFLITDLSVEEAEGPVTIMGRVGLDPIFLAAPTSTEDRIHKIAALSRGFIYAISRTGVTGVQNSLSSEIGPMLDRIRRHSSLPVAVGFGISRPEQVREAVRQADGVVVGSAIVRCIEENLGSPRLPEAVADFTRWLRGGM